MTNNSSQAGSSRQKPSLIRRITRSMGKEPQVMLSGKRGKATVVEAEPTSKYSPVKYPIFPSPIWGPDEDEPDTWTLFSPSWRPCRVAPEPRPTPEDEPELMIRLRGSDTVYPGSPGRLPESIPSSKWWEEVLGNNCKETPHMNWVKYAEKTWKLRIPVKDFEKKKAKTGEVPIKADNPDEWYSKHLQPPNSPQ